MLDKHAEASAVYSDVGAVYLSYGRVNEDLFRQCFVYLLTKLKGSALRGCKAFLPVTENSF